jgi:glycosyltransferase involved in cell wall biosynthesis
MTTRVPGRVSVVIPCFNGARFLREAIDSAIAQTYADVEIVVADDGSTDDSVAIVASYGDRVRGLRQANAGPSAARNLALRAATGEFVALLDADDRYHPQKLERQVGVLRARPDVSVVYCGWRLVDGDGRELPERGWPRAEGDLLERLVLGNLFHPVSVVLRRQIVDAAGGFDERCPVNEDWDLFLRASRQGGRWTCIEEILCDYRIHPGQSHQRLALVHDVAREILGRFFADPTLAESTRRLEPRAYEEADLRAAAELYAAGATAGGDVAFRRAVARRPGILGEPRTMIRFLRMVLPDGVRSRAEVIHRRREMTRLLRTILKSGARGPWEQGRAWTTLVRAAARLEVRAWLQGARWGQWGKVGIGWLLTPAAKGRKNHGHADLE